MQENSNKTLAINSIILYLRMGINILCSLFITRFALQALGVDDFGLFSVVGSVITFVGLINTIMLRTTNRFIAVALGTGDNKEVNKVFNVCLVIHILIALLSAIIAIPIGELYIHHYVNYNGPIENALMVYRLSISASIISFVSVPYNGLLMAKEKFVVFCGVDVVSHILKLIASMLILYFFDNKLLFFASTQAILTAYPLLVYRFYCRCNYSDLVKWNFVKEKKIYKEMASFSGWVSFGALATIGKSQGAQLLINAFFNTAMNAALGIANTINALVTTFASNITQPIDPQITKSYAAGNMERCSKLLVMSIKFSFLGMMLVSSPFFSDMDWILKMWLGEIPPYVSLFAKLLVLDVLVGSFNSGISTIVFANGKIGFYQITINVMNVMAVLLAYIALKKGMPAYNIFYIYILCTFIKLIFGQLSLQLVGGISFKILAKEAYMPSLLVSFLYIPILLVNIPILPILHILLVLTYLLLLILFVGLRKQERIYIFSLVTKVFNRL